MEDHELLLVCRAMIGVIIDEELHQKTVDALRAEPLKSQVEQTIRILEGDSDLRTRMFALQTIIAAVWQHGYRAAPKLEFVLPEGAGG